MAIISFTNYKRGQTTGCMGAVMRYTMQDKKTEFDGQRLVTGINCQPESVYADFMTCLLYTSRGICIWITLSCQAPSKPFSMAAHFF